MKFFSFALLNAFVFSPLSFAKDSDVPLAFEDQKARKAYVSTVLMQPPSQALDEALIAMELTNYHRQWAIRQNNGHIETQALREHLNSTIQKYRELSEHYSSSQRNEVASNLVGTAIRLGSTFTGPWGVVIGEVSAIAAERATKYAADYAFGPWDEAENIRRQSERTRIRKDLRQRREEITGEYWDHRRSDFQEDIEKVTEGFVDHFLGISPKDSADNIARSNSALMQQLDNELFRKILEGKASRDDLQALSQQMSVMLDANQSALEHLLRAHAKEKKPEIEKARKQLHTQARYAALSIVGNLLNLAFQNDPDAKRTANQLIGTGKAVLDIHQSFEKFLSNKTLSPGAAATVLSGDVFGAVMHLLSLFSGQKSPEQAILEQIQKLHERLAGIEKALGRIDEKLSLFFETSMDEFHKLHQRLGAISGQIVNLDDRTKSVRNRVKEIQFGMADFKVRLDYLNSSIEMNKKESREKALTTWKEDCLYPAETIQGANPDNPGQCLRQLNAFVLHSYDPTSKLISRDFQSLRPWLYDAALTRRLEEPGFLAELLEEEFDPKVAAGLAVPGKVVNSSLGFPRPLFWGRITDYFVEFFKRWPEMTNDLGARPTELFASVGSAFKHVVHNLKENSQTKESRLPLMIAQIDGLEGAANQVAHALQAVIDEYSDDHYNGVNPWEPADQIVDYDLSLFENRVVGIHRKDPRFQADLSSLAYWLERRSLGGQKILVRSLTNLIPREILNYLKITGKTIRIEYGAGWANMKASVNGGYDSPESLGFQYPTATSIISNKDAKGLYWKDKFREGYFLTHFRQRYQANLQLGFSYFVDGSNTPLFRHYLTHPHFSPDVYYELVQTRRTFRLNKDENGFDWLKGEEHTSPPSKTLHYPVSPYDLARAGSSKLGDSDSRLNTALTEINKGSWKSEFSSSSISHTSQTHSSTQSEIDRLIKLAQETIPSYQNQFLNKFKDSIHGKLSNHPICSVDSNDSTDDVLSDGKVKDLVVALEQFTLQSKTLRATLQMGYGKSLKHNTALSLAYERLRVNEIYDLITELCTKDKILGTWISLFRFYDPVSKKQAVLGDLKEIQNAVEAIFETDPQPEIPEMIEDRLNAIEKIEDLRKLKKG